MTVAQRQECGLRHCALLQPRSYVSSGSAVTSPPTHAVGQGPAPSRPSQDANSIRDFTMEISGIPLTSPPPLSLSHSRSVSLSGPEPPAPTDEFIFPHPSASASSSIAPSAASSAVDLTASTITNATVTTTATTTTTSTGSNTAVPSAVNTLRAPSPVTHSASALTLLMAEHGSSRESSPGRTRAGDATPRPRRAEVPISPMRESVQASQDVEERISVVSPSIASVDEQAPLLGDLEAAHPGYGSGANGRALPGSPGEPAKPRPGLYSRMLRAGKGKVHIDGKSVKQVGQDAVSAVPAVVLGALLNVLDGVSYGMIIFPASGVFAGLGPMGVSMFFVSAIVAQLIYSAGASGLAGANGSMMIEVVPFFHILANRIAAEIGEDRPEEIIATTLVAFAFSSVLTGLTFFLLGAFRLGNLIGFFPRHILVGCIGGVGVFLVITGLTVSTRMADDDFSLSFATLKFFLTAHNLALWAPAFALATILRVITHRLHHQLILPIYFIVIPIIFYIIVAAARLNLHTLRREGWLFDVAASQHSWYEFYTYFSFRKTQWGPLWATLPTQLALLFFNILHPPLNVPALAVSLNEDVDTNKELVAHGYSNLVSGFLGTVPNYLVYVNTLLFYRVGGTTRVSGFMLAGATALLLFIGTGPIAFIPVMVVAALIFVLGIDLVKEALWDTRHRVNRSEYITIISIMIVMTVWDFVIGVLFGIIVSSLFFVVQSSQRQSIRAIHSGETVMSTVRRPSAHRAYIREASKQTTVIRLQGFMFFGTITHVEDTIRALIENPAPHPFIQFLVVDFSLVAGVDLSAAEAFVRIQRMMAARRIVLVFCGIGKAGDGNVARALQSVGLLDTDGVEVFDNMNDAVEWTENVYLRAWFLSAKPRPNRSVCALHYRISYAYSRMYISAFRPSRWYRARDPRVVAKLATASPAPRCRLAHIRSEYVLPFRTLSRLSTPVPMLTVRARPSVPPDLNSATDSAPLYTLMHTFSSFGPVDRETFRPLIAYLERIPAPDGLVLWTQGDAPDGLYIVESGVLRASYCFTDHAPPIEESMVPGTLAGELSALSGLPRNATVVVERPAVLWKLSIESMRRLEREKSDLARMFMALVVKGAFACSRSLSPRWGLTQHPLCSCKEDYDILLSALATRQ
ncbi:hypothetical protein EVG20_g8313 [Dentipellis fragilis]|uniref:STAS domain-containing protein n=1 Tax=Dentipellis fragilis TaxID=205917 RepID=A0A4Y9Y7Z7_9AGAM|nr:hypothetical protein EVG20_g8313 [Dentipellis fragilis]